jgi:hypothetical protein
MRLEGLRDLMENTEQDIEDQAGFSRPFLRLRQLVLQVLLHHR